MDDDVGEELAYRVVSAAHRRRIRLLVLAGLVTVTLGGGAAVALTHRSGAEPSRPAAAGQSGTASTADVRRDIYAVARAQYPSSPGRTTKVKFGPLVVRGSYARLSVEILCGPLCSSGEELSLARQHGRWQVTAVRHTWIS